MIKLSTWNICLGLKNKKDYIYQVIDEKEIDVCLLQEVEIDKDYDANLLTKGQFKIEVEKNKVKARVAILIKDNVEYVRRRDLEGEDLGIVIVDLIGINKFRVINLYRSFNPNNNMSPLQFINSQLQLINDAVLSANDRKIIIAGDFNLDETKRFAADYKYKQFFETQNTIFDHLNLMQMVNEPTWKRVVMNVNKFSTIDHIYITNPFHVSNVTLWEPLIGDHSLITFEISSEKNPPLPLMKRNWSQ